MVAASFILIRFLSDDDDGDDRSSGAGRRFATNLLIDVRYKLEGIVAPVPFNCHHCWSSVNYLMIVTFSGYFSLPVSLPRA